MPDPGAAPAEADAAPAAEVPDGELPPRPGSPARHGGLVFGEAERHASVLPPGLPEKVAIPAGTRIQIMLETPLSSRFSRRGQAVIFRTSSWLALGPGLDVPPGMEIRGRLSDVNRPGAFGKSGALRVSVEEIVLPGAPPARLRAQLRSAGMNSRGRLTTEGRRSLSMQNLAVFSLQGTMAGAQFGGKAAGIGAGAGAAIAAVLMMSQRGRDVSISAGTPFSARLQQDVELPSAAVYEAQDNYARTRGGSSSHEEWDDELDDSPRPVLKRRGSPQP
jgi:hypothetical protein